MRVGEVSENTCGISLHCFVAGPTCFLQAHAFVVNGPQKAPLQCGFLPLSTLPGHGRTCSRQRRANGPWMQVIRPGVTKSASCRLPPHSFPLLLVYPRLFAMTSCTSRFGTLHWILKPIRIHVLHFDCRSNHSTSRQQQKQCWFPESKSPGNISCECTSRRTCSPAALARHLLLTTEPHLC